MIIALSLQDQELPPAKALYRAGQSLAALGRWDEARDVVNRGKELQGEEGKVEWKRLGEEVEKGQRLVEERKERERRTKLSEIALRQAIHVSVFYNPSYEFS